VLDNRQPDARNVDPRRISIVASGAESLLATLPVASGRARARQILKAKGVRIMRLSFDAGQTMKEHVEYVPVLIQTLQGSVILSVSGEQIEMPAGAIVHLDKQLAHSITALEESHLMVTLLGAHNTKPHAEQRASTGELPRSAKSRVPTAGRIQWQGTEETEQWAQQNFVLSATGADSDAFVAITRGHAELQGELAERTARLLDLLAEQRLPLDARDELVEWTRSRVIPYLAREAAVFYPVVSARPQQRPLIEVLTGELAQITVGLDRLAEAKVAFDIGSAAIALRVMVGRHLAAERDILLPTLAVSSDDSLATLWARVNVGQAALGEDVSSGVALSRA
jgi:quercetin dioxygenase-like cupin family protein